MRLGGCQCGAVRFSVAGEARALYVCHCRECQKQSASAFGMSLQVSRARLKLLSGKPRTWSRATDSGRRLDCVFCGECGSRLWHERDAASETVTIKAGCLDLPVDVSEATHIWTVRKLPGVCIPENARRYPGEPPE